MTPSSLPRGYTLIEVLIAVSVFAVLAGSVYLALSALSEAAFVQRERSQELAALQLSVTRLEADLRQLVSRPVRRFDEGLAPALDGQRDRFEATRAGWANLGDQRRSQLQRFGWQRQGEGLVRQFHPVTDPAGAGARQTETVLDAVDGFELEYRSEDDRWLDQWPPEAALEALPSAVRYRLRTARFGVIERIVVL
ncbi:type II secretion system minor pseudopilin GspJ [Wenzhouxiangella limi]|uniref:Type II secretion system protein J n=1 Tax=Wenzhouxiangella limi TaxID=2707351 RepID=A0A845V148_9GAMM|nr:type II secretion system minor pseudopilin GspJ [Wenzhouxiangella limi]NDY96454.1 type II secretion system minor pseudopilin GspJ [Wenzhouxiangella limi]